MCRIHKGNGVLDVNANPYIFKNFNRPCKTENKETQTFQNEVLHAENDLKKIRMQADKLVEDAELKANGIIQRAGQEASMLMNKARMEGYQNGWNAANQKIEECLNQTNQAAQGLLESTKVKTDEVLAQLEENTLEVAFGIAEKILNTELERRDSCLIGIIKKGMQKLKDQTQAKLILHTEDLKRLSEAEAFQTLKEQSGVRLQILADDSLKKGDVLIQTEEEKIDAGINTQLNNLKAAVMGQQ